MISLSISLSLSHSLSIETALGSTTNRPTKQNIGASPAGEHLQLETRVLVLWRGRGHKKTRRLWRGAWLKNRRRTFFFLESTLKPTWRWWKVAGCNRRWGKVAMKVRSLSFETNLEDLFQVRVVSMFWEFRKPTLNKTRAIGLVFGALSFPEQKVGGSNHEWCWDRKFWIFGDFVNWMTEGSRKNWTATDLYCLELCKMIPAKTFGSISLLIVNFIMRSRPKNFGFWWLSSGNPQTAWFQWWTSLIHPDIHPGNFWTLNTKLNHTSTENKGALKQNTFFPFKYSGLLWVYLRISGWLHCVQTFVLFEPWAFWVATFTPTFQVPHSEVERWCNEVSWSKGCGESNELGIDERVGDHYILVVSQVLLIFTPIAEEMIQFDLRIFFKWVETTN